MRRQVRIGFSVIIIAVLFTLVQASEQGASFQGNKINNDGGTLTSIIDRTITYQGILKTNTGSPVPDNNYNLTFRIYKQSSGGTALWTSSSIPVATDGGLFSTQLGPISLPFDTTYYISIEVAGDVEMSRQMITMSPYSASADTANYADNADMLDNQHASAFSVVGHTHVITSSDIQNGTIQFEDIGQNSATTGQVMKWNGSAWVARNDSVGTASGDNKWVFRITDSADTTIISGSKWGISRNGNTLYGNADSTHINLGVQCITGTSGQNYKYCTVGGGSSNNAGNSYATIAGGYNNAAGGVFSGAIAGRNNVAGNAGVDTGAVVAGGVYNSALGMYITVGGGANNTANWNYAAIGGGSSNAADGYYAVVAGGESNTTSANWSAIGGGNHNITSGADASISGGFHNTASGGAAAIGGGGYNTSSGEYAAIGGGYGNVVSGYAAAIGGGIYDTIDVSGNHSFVFGYAVYCNDDFRTIFYDGGQSGSFNINRDSRDGYSNYPLQIGTSASNGNGAYLSNGGTWTNVSSRTLKENFTPFNGAELLRKISSLSITTYNYKNSTEKHVGPVAEEFVGAFDTGVIRESDGKRDDMALSAGDVAGVALAGVQELLKKIEALEKEVAALKAQQGQR